MDAAEYLNRALALVPGLGDHARIPGSAPPSAAADDAWSLLERAASLEPGNAAVHAARGNLLLRRGRTGAALRSYTLAARLDPHDAPSRLVLGELAFMAGDELSARTWFDEAYALTRLYSPAPRAGARSALVLCVRGPWHRNVPLDFVVDPAQWSLHRWYVPDDARAGALPPHELAINAIGESIGARPALEAAQRFVAGAPATINAPAAVRRTARHVLAQTLDGIPGCATAPVRRAGRDELDDVHEGFPLVVRPADAHGGRGLERIDGPAELAAYATRVPAAVYDLAPFVEYRSADGYYRKYRVMFVDGRPYPYHLALDTAWMIHYHRAPMDAAPWMREEERRFLAAPERALGGWNTTLPAIAAAVGLDYFGIDCTVLADGTLFVFEADAAMLVHGFDPDAEKRAAYAGICSALGALMTARAGPPQPSARNAT